MVWHDYCVKCKTLRFSVMN
uniref:Uncharacterized protein n=1 Tax=Arundo donax TaxID=35708 RepID=A0A0A8XSS8_ARUDO